MLDNSPKTAMGLIAGKKTDRLFFIFSSVQQMLQPLIFKINALFFKEYLNHQARINKMVNKDFVNYHPSLSKVTLRIDPFIFLYTMEGFISAQNHCLNFFKNCISHWFRKIFKCVLFRLLENAFASQQ